MRTALATRDESKLDDAQFALIHEFSRTALQPSPQADDKVVRDVIGSLAGVLKQAKTSVEAGVFKLGLYRKALVGEVGTAALNYAAERALRECEWMPTPAELLRFAKEYVRPDVQARDHARQLVTDRKARYHATTMRQLRAGEVPADELGNLPESLIEHAVEARVLMWTLDADLVYATPENLAQDAKARRAFTAGLLGKAPA